MRPHLAIPFTTLAATLALAGSAAADVRYAAPAGDGPQTDCLLADPCSIENAVGFAGVDDTVRLLAGTYTLTDTLDLFDGGVTLEPATPGTRPVIRLNANTKATVRVAVGGLNPKPVTIRGLEVESLSGDSNSDDHPALQLNSPATVTDVLARSRARVITQGSNDPAPTVLEDVRVEQVAGTERAVKLATAAGPLTARRLVVEAATGGVGIEVTGVGAELTDSTARGGGTGAMLRDGAVGRRLTVAGTLHGALVDGPATLTDTVATASGLNGRAVLVEGPGIVQLRNITAVAGGVGSVGLLAGGGPTTARNVIARGTALDLKAAPGTLTVDHASFRTADGITDGGANQAADPQFVDAAAGDFRLAPTSPAIDAGVADDQLAATDLAGASRFQLAAPDLGAYEAAAKGAPQQPGPGGTPADTTAPAVTALRGSGKRRGAAKARFSLGEAANVTVKLERRKAGKRKGGRCVKPTRKLRNAKRCTRFVTVATTTRSLAAGSASVKLGRKLAAGRYRVTVVAQDAAGNRAQPVGKRFKVAR
jgi:hypothetical protein